MYLPDALNWWSRGSVISLEHLPGKQSMSIWDKLFEQHLGRCTVNILIRLSPFRIGRMTVSIMYLNKDTFRIDNMLTKVSVKNCSRWCRIRLWAICCYWRQHFRCVNAMYHTLNDNIITWEHFVHYMPFELIHSSCPLGYYEHGNKINRNRASLTFAGLFHHSACQCACHKLTTLNIQIMC